MTVTFYKDFKKKKNSTKRPTGGTSFNAKLKQPTSMKSPILVIASTDFDYNYASFGGRYYYIHDVVSVNNSMSEYHLTLDVLATYKDDIGASSNYVLRSSALSDGEVIDTFYPTVPKAERVETLITGNIWTKITPFTGSYIVGIASGLSGASNGISYYKMSANQFASLRDFMFNSAWLSADEITEELQKQLVNPLQYITSIMYMPFEVSTAGIEVNVKFGWWESTVSGELLSNTDRTRTIIGSVTVPRHPQSATRGNFLNGSPFSEHVLNLYNWCNIPINSNYFMTSATTTLEIFITTDIFTGVGELRITDSNARILYKSSVQVGLTVPLNYTQTNYVDGAIQFIKSATQMSAAAINGDIINTITGVGGICDAVSNAMPTLIGKGTECSTACYSVEPTLVSTFYTLVDEDNVSNGRPLCKVKTINTLSGYIKCANAKVESSADFEEQLTIIYYMNGGFFYE